MQVQDIPKEDTAGIDKHKKAIAEEKEGETQGLNPIATDVFHL